MRLTATTTTTQERGRVCPQTSRARLRKYVVRGALCVVLTQRTVSTSPQVQSLRLAGGQWLRYGGTGYTLQASGRGAATAPATVRAL